MAVSVQTHFYDQKVSGNIRNPHTTLYGIMKYCIEKCALREKRGGGGEEKLGAVHIRFLQPTVRFTE